MDSTILQHYQTLAIQYQSVTDQRNKQIKLISVARFFCFVGIIPAYYYLYKVNGILALTASLFLIVLFLILVKWFILKEKQRLFFQRLVEINQNEISAINSNLSSFDPGNEFTDQRHDYSFDLDIYGIGSIFQFLNRTVTQRGKKQLASMLNQTQRPIIEITERQEAIEELAGELNWRQHFLANGKNTEDLKTSVRIDETIHQFIPLHSVKVLKYLLNILPILTLLLIGLNLTGIVSKYYLLPVFMQWIIFIVYSKTISSFYKQFESQSKVLARHSEMLKHIESGTFKSGYLNRLKERLTHQKKTASKITAELQKTLNEFEYRQNILVGFVLDSVFLWDIRCILKLYKWQQAYSTDLPKWFDVIAEMDALISLANCNYNHSEWATPKVFGPDFVFKAEELGHPLIDESRCVKNSFQIVAEEQIVIITGANMAGKSTFLRTIGINIILGSIGCRVCAESFEFSPVRVYTNMRTTDNLMKDESYFYAELLRLQSILSLLRSGEKLFVILDEMLKGTNSIDKLNGSKELINQLIKLKAHGIVATHDLGLTELALKYPSAIKNQCFEVKLNADELSFDYRLADGVTRTMNATFLMKKMGIIP